MFIVIALKRIFGGIGSFFSGLAYAGYICIWDISLLLLNLVSFKRKVGKVISQGTPGFGGQWPEYKPPKDTDSRSACPALNALANHGRCFVLFIIHFSVIVCLAFKMKDSKTVFRSRVGILPRDGRNITYPQMTAACRNVYNFAPSFAYFVPNYIGKILTRDYNKDTINLSDISVHNGIEHDASLTRTFIPVLPQSALSWRRRLCMTWPLPT